MGRVRLGVRPAKAYSVRNANSRWVYIYAPRKSDRRRIFPAKRNSAANSHAIFCALGIYWSLLGRFFFCIISSIGMVKMRMVGVDARAAPSIFLFPKFYGFPSLRNSAEFPNEPTERLNAFWPLRELRSPDGRPNRSARTRVYSEAWSARDA